MVERFEIELDKEEEEEYHPKPDKKTLAILSAAVFLDMTNVSWILSIVPYMVEWFMGDDLGDDRDRTISIYSGILGGAFTTGQFIGQFPIGLLSDRWGRKPFLLLGTVAIFINNIFFLFNKYYWAAVACRMTCGLLVANGALARTYLTEWTDEMTRPAAFTAVNIAHILAIIVAPSLGGFTSRPADKWSIFDNWFWRDYEYSLPFACIAALSLILIIFIVIFLREPISRLKPEPLLRNFEEASEAPPLRLSPWQAIKILFRNPIYVVSLVAACNISYAMGMHQELIPLWAKANHVNGGLGWENKESWIGLVFSAAGASALIFGSIVVPWSVKKMGANPVSIGSNFILSPIMIAYGFTRLFSTDIAMAFYISTVNLFLGAMSSGFWISNALVINSTADKRVIGSANGISVALSNLARTFGPLTAGFMFGWTTQNNLDFPFNYWMPLLYLATLCLISAVLCVIYATRTSTTNPKEESS